MSFIRINRTAEKVEVTLDPGQDSSGVEIRCLKLEWNCSSEIFAALLMDRLRERLRKTMEEVRRESYDRGWKDAKGKKFAKRTSHWGAMP